MNFLIIGSSAAALFALEEIRRRCPQDSITVLTADSCPSYSRCLTTYFLAGDIPEQRLFVRPPGYFEDLDVDIHYEARVTAINPSAKTVTTEDRREWSYDRLLIASGASANKLDIPGSDLPEVFTLRHLEDARAIAQTLAAPTASDGQSLGSAVLGTPQRAVVIGGGLVSLKSAYALNKRGLDVQVVVSSKHILSQMLDEQAAAIIAAHLKNHGIAIHFNQDVLAINEEHGHVSGVTLKDGTELPADLVLVGKGVKPNIDFLEDTGVELHYGIKVNSYMQTNVPDIYAAGDVAETWDKAWEQIRINATWPNATLQGRIAGANMAGAQISYSGSIPLNSVDFYGLSVISAGMTRLPQDIDAKDGCWEIRESYSPHHFRNQGESYQKLIWKEGKLKGYILLGDTAQAGVLTSLLKEGRQLTPTEMQKLQLKRTYANLCKR